jgi:hypothetical protein
MKTFTKFFALLFAFLLFISFNASASVSPWTNPDGDNGQPLLEVWVYGVNLPGGITAVPGDQIAVFDGGTLVGLLTLTKTPSVQEWINCRLVAYSQNTTGNQLYSPNNPFSFKFWDESTGIVYNSWGWGTGGGIDFHDDWYAPTSEDPQATTTGAYFPAEGAYSYCYTNLTFTTDVQPLLATVDVTVWLADGTTPVNMATVTAGGYAATQVGNIYTLDLFAGNNGDNEDYVYTVTIAHSNYKTETFDITVNEVDQGTPYTQDVFLGGEGKLDGFVKAFDLVDGWEYVENATVSTMINGELYTDNTDITGYYLIDTIPDGEWMFTYSYPGHLSQEVSATIDKDGSTTSAADVSLDLLRGTMQGDIFSAISTNLIADPGTPVTVTLNDIDGNFMESTTTSTGHYEISYYGGVYDIVVSCTGYDDFTVDDHTFYPDFTEDMNFNLLPENTDPHFAAITGNPNQLWSIHIEMAKFGINTLLPWDELVIFDTDQSGLPDEPGLRVGTLQLPNAAIWQNSGSNVLKAFGQFSNGTTGFVQGNHIEFWAYDISNGAVYEAPIDWWFNAGVGTYSGNTFPDPNANHVSYLNIYWETVPGQIVGTVVDDGFNPIFGATVEALNVYTHEVVSTSTTDVDGAYTIANLPESSYDIRYSMNGYDTYTRDTVAVRQSMVRDLGEQVLGARTFLTLHYILPTQGFFFVGRALVTEPVDEDNMLTLLDNSIGSYTPFSEGYFTSWVENDQHIRLDNTVASPDNTTWSDLNYKWELSEGYQIFRSIHYRFDMTGYLVKPEQNPIRFDNAGIYYIPYFPYSGTEYDEALTAFGSILDSLDWVMDSEGNRLHHDNGIWTDNIGVMSPTEGYKIKLNHSVTLTYPEAATKAPSAQTVRLEPEHFVFDGGNAAEWTYTIYIDTDEFDIGDEIAAFSNGIMVGSMVIDSDDPWQNDLNTFNNAVEGGYEINSPIEFRAWDVSENVDYQVMFTMVEKNSACYMGVNFPAGLDHFSYANVTRGIVGVDENQVENSVKVYPNPVRGTLNIQSLSTIKQINLYSVYGATISSISVNTTHQQIDVRNLKPGTYLVQLTTENGVITKRIIVQ